jgi:hypothetical protein
VRDYTTELTREAVEAQLDGVKPWHDTVALGTHHFAHSMAVSLKRIADALEKQNEIALGIAQGFPTGEEFEA